MFVLGMQSTTGLPDIFYIKDLTSKRHVLQKMKIIDYIQLLPRRREKNRGCQNALHPGKIVKNAGFLQSEFTCENGYNIIKNCILNLVVNQTNELIIVITSGAKCGRFEYT